MLYPDELKLRIYINGVMEIIEILKNASQLVYQNVRDMAGTASAGGNYGVGAGGDVSRNIDMTAEKTVIDYVKSSGFSCKILGEECGMIQIGDHPQGSIIMDAIDGSTNAVRGVPFFCCSLAFAHGDNISDVTDGVVKDLVRGDTYWASKGKGAYKNDDKIHVGETEQLYRVILLNVSGSTKEDLARLQPLFENTYTRHFGANALEMALLACGVADGFVDLRGKIRVHDLAAGYVILKEAGGIICDTNNNPLDGIINYTTRISFLAAANNDIMKEITRYIN